MAPSSCFAFFWRFMRSPPVALSLKPDSPLSSRRVGSPGLVRPEHPLLSISSSVTDRVGTNKVTPLLIRNQIGNPRWLGDCYASTPVSARQSLRWETPALFPVRMYIVQRTQRAVARHVVSLKDMLMATGKLEFRLLR